MNMKTPSSSSRAYSVLVCYALTLSMVCADFVTSPNPTPPDIPGAGIFLTTSAEFSTARVQEVHAARDFINASGPVLMITEISYSAPMWSGRVPIDVTLPNIEIRMSTTLRGADGLSTTFSDNIGPDQMVVYSGPLHFYETEQELYDIHVPIAPFRYDPSAGSLLIDIFNYAPLLSRRDPDWMIDGVDKLGDSVSSVGGRATDPSGSLGSWGQVARFTYTPVPEPATWTLFSIGAIGLAIIRRKSNCREG